MTFWSITFASASRASEDEMSGSSGPMMKRPASRSTPARRAARSTASVAPGLPIVIIRIRGPAHSHLVRVRVRVRLRLTVRLRVRLRVRIRVRVRVRVKVRVSLGLRLRDRPQGDIGRARVSKQRLCTGRVRARVSCVVH